MFKYLLTLCLSTFAVSLWAQAPWQINGYDHTATIDVDSIKKTTTVTMDQQSATFDLKRVGTQWQLKNANDATTILQFIQVDAFRINDKYASYGQNLNAAEKLINRAASLPHHTLSIVNAADTAAASPEDGALTPNPTAATTSTNKGQTSVWWLPLAALLGGAIVYVIMIQKKQTPAHAKTHSMEDDTSLTTTNERTANVGTAKKTSNQNQLEKLLSEKAKWQTEKTSLTKAVKVQKAELEAYDTYFKTAFQKLVLPTQQALDKADQTAVVSNLLKIMAQYTALTRVQLHKDLPYDQGNINYLVNGQTTSGDTITAQTPPDFVPNNIAIVMQLMHDNDVHTLDDTLIMGYKIKDI